MLVAAAGWPSSVPATAACCRSTPGLAWSSGIRLLRAAVASTARFVSRAAAPEAWAEPGVEAARRNPHPGAPPAL